MVQQPIPAIRSTVGPNRVATAPTAIRTPWQDRQCGLRYVQNIVEETVTAGAPEISAIVEDLFSMDGMHDIYRIRGDDAEFSGGSPS